MIWAGFIVLAFVQPHITDRANVFNMRRVSWPCSRSVDARLTRLPFGCRALAVHLYGGLVYATRGQPARDACSQVRVLLSDG
jgi:hypothetical protein